VRNWANCSLQTDFLKVLLQAAKPD